MWYECLPSMVIISVAMSIPNIAQWGINKLFNEGNAYNRIMNERWDRMLFKRDECLTGSAYKCNGLETIPDTAEKQ